jgi:tetratricopeptide (TPR) repeat protein
VSRRERIDRFETEDATQVMDRGSIFGGGGGGGDGGGDDFDIASLLPRLDDHPGPARRIPSARAAAMVRSITDIALQPPMVLPEGTRPALPPAPEIAPRRAAPRRVVALLAAAVVVTAVGAATAAVWVATVQPAPAPIPVPAPAPAPRRVPAVEPPEEELIIEEEDTLDEELAQEEEQETLDMPAEIVSAKRDRERRPALRELAEDAPPEDILALANTRRKEKRWRDADALYRRVMVRHKGSDASVFAAVASAALHLDRLGDPAGALRRYRRALRVQPSGALAEEARWGVAESLRAVDDTDAEAEALRAFLASHRDSVNAPAAQRRLSEIARLR